VTKAPGCPLCEGPGGTVVFQGPRFRLVRADEPGFPAFYRLVWTGHVPLCMAAVAEVELALRSHLRPDKVNLAALGNAVPHLHWHIVARFAWDSHFPGSVWAGAQREIAVERVAAVEALLPALERDLADRLARGPGNCSAP
jgi:hypothetical protein